MLLQLTYQPFWQSQGATVHCGCGVYKHYAHKDSAHSFANAHAKATNHMVFVQPVVQQLGKLDWITKDGEIEESGDCS